MEGRTDQLILLKPKELKKKLNAAMEDGINSIVFCTLEGSPLAQVTDPGYKSKTAVVANIFYEYMDLGTHAFNENTLESIIIENQEGFVMAKNVHNHILCFFCQDTCKKGYIMRKMEALGGALSTQLEPLNMVQ
ncbi:unnamed protein product [Moneuplotes crassus]|uniref:Roadblock/LAMTOR2 domain-containing protein n=1 Tax=Euplotes crassus TaxID=5936 RepID=A0AAD1Y2G2_EUPCR|nr:unnamed protein product [Moneuplotes crassus]